MLVITYYFTRHDHAFPTRDQRASTVRQTALEALHIVHHVIPGPGVSIVIRGQCFEYAVIQELCKLIETLSHLFT